MARKQEQPKPCATCGAMMVRKRYGKTLEDMGAFRNHSTRRSGFRVSGRMALPA